MTSNARADGLEEAESVSFDAGISTLSSALHSATCELISIGQLCQAVRAGKPAPEFWADDQRGMSASLTALLDRGRLVIVFGSQPWYLPYNHELQSLNEAVPRIRCADANLIAISPRSVAQNLKVWRECALNFPVLSDERNEIAEAFGLRIRFPDHLVGFSQKLGHESPALDEANNRTLAVRAQYLVNRDGTIVYSEIEPSFTSRLDLTGVMRVLESRIASRERRM